MVQPDWEQRNVYVSLTFGLYSHRSLSSQPPPPAMRSGTFTIYWTQANEHLQGLCSCRDPSTSFKSSQALPDAEATDIHGPATGYVRLQRQQQLHHNRRRKCKFSLPWKHCHLRSRPHCAFKWHWLYRIWIRWRFSCEWHLQWDYEPSSWFVSFLWKHNHQ